VTAPADPHPDEAYDWATDPGFDRHAGRLPRLGEVVRDTERLLVQALNVLDRPVDASSVPTQPAWPGHSDVTVLDLHISNALADIRGALDALQRIPVAPPAGSAVKLPARQDPPDPLVPGPAVATTGGPVDHPYPRSGEGAAPRLDAATAEADVGSPGVVDPGAGALPDDATRAFELRYGDDPLPGDLCEDEPDVAPLCTGKGQRADGPAHCGHNFPHYPHRGDRRPTRP